MTTKTPNALVADARSLVSRHGPAEDWEGWIKTVRDTDSEGLVEAVAQFTSEPGHGPADLKACREAVLAEIGRKNAAKIVETMETLDRSANRLTVVSLSLTIVGTLFTLVQILQAFHVLPSP